MNEWNDRPTIHDTLCELGRSIETVAKKNTTYSILFYFYVLCIWELDMVKDVQTWYEIDCWQIAEERMYVIYNSNVV